MNSRISAKERRLLKGAIRRVFSRSELRRKVVEEATITHCDLKCPRVTKWGRCARCRKPIARYQLEVDHLHPIVPLNTTLEKMSWDHLIDNVWCDSKDLNAVCKPCHKEKTRVENALRRRKLK